eukprot:254240-Chlamydomonas_euryale.AAC.1
MTRCQWTCRWSRRACVRARRTCTPREVRWRWGRGEEGRRSAPHLGASALGSRRHGARRLATHTHARTHTHTHSPVSAAACRPVACAPAPAPGAPHGSPTLRLAAGTS